MTQEYDQGSPYSPLSQSIIKALGISDATGLKGFIYKATKGEIASLSSLVFKEAESGNEAAKKYFYDAGTDLANQTATLSHKLKLQAPVKIACMGSLLEKNQYVQKAFKESLLDLVGETEIIMEDISPAIGARSLAAAYS